MQLHAPQKATKPQRKNAKSTKAPKPEKAKKEPKRAMQWRQPAPSKKAAAPKKPTERKRSKPAASAPREFALMLQIKDLKDKDWSTLRRIDINEGTTAAVKEEFCEELLDLKYRWINSNYWSGCESYRIHELGA